MEWEKLPGIICKLQTVEINRLEYFILVNPVIFRARYMKRSDKLYRLKF